MDNRAEVYVNDLARRAAPLANLSQKRLLDKWEIVPYETTEQSGTLLSAMKNVRPDPVVISLNLTGWYRIYACLPSYGTVKDFSVNLQLTRDKAFSQLSPSGRQHGTFEEVYWKSADLTGQDITLSKFKTGCEHDAMLAWLRFVPMSEAEVETYTENQQRRDTKRIYATHDMHGH